MIVLKIDPEYWQKLQAELRRIPAPFDTVTFPAILTCQTAGNYRFGGLT
jgi:hypothetical protein